LQRNGLQLGDPPLPAARAEHVPTEPAALHSAQLPVHAELQHTPSAQKPEVHWTAVVHAAPSPDFGTHAPVWQKCVASHCASEVHEVGQAELAPLQVNGAHDGLPCTSAGCSVHVPIEAARLHALHEPRHVLLQHTPSTHSPLTHALPPPQPCPLRSFEMHAPAEQKRPAAQSASPVQVIGQAALAPLHTNAPHDGEPPLPCGDGAQVPGVAPLH
jgi:hypothetical protein